MIHRLLLSQAFAGRHFRNLEFFCGLRVAPITERTSGNRNFLCRRTDGVSSPVCQLATSFTLSKAAGDRFGGALFSYLCFSIDNILRLQFLKRRYTSSVRFSKISALKGLRKVLTVDSSIQVGVCGPSVWVKVEGKGSFLNSDNLKEFACAMLDQGYREFVVDLADCAMMDSTFMGTMARLALRLRELGHGHLHIVHCGSRNQQLLFRAGFGPEYSILMLVAAVRQTVALLSKPLWRYSPEEAKKDANADDAGSA